jgi:hypothetical protein
MKRLFSFFFTFMVAVSCWASVAHNSWLKETASAQIYCAECYEIERDDEGPAIFPTYEKVTDACTSYREQTLIHLTLDNSEQLTATEGHPFLTSEGWRDAILLKRGGKLLIKGDAEADAKDGETAQDAISKAIFKPNKPVAGINTAQSAIKGIVDERSDSAYRTILEVRIERQTVPVFNIEVANAHTFFVGDEGVLVHNASANGGIACKHGGAAHDAWIDRYIRRLERWKVADTGSIRKNQQQVNALGNNVGKNRPDIQFDRNGKHHNREVDTNARNSQNHLNTLNRNDPNAANRGSVLK